LAITFVAMTTAAVLMAYIPNLTDSGLKPSMEVHDDLSTPVSFITLPTA